MKLHVNAGYLKHNLKEGGGEIAVILISGTVIRYGFCGYCNERLASIIAEAEKPTRCKGDRVEIDTPCATVDSTDLLADAVKSFSKPIVAWTNYYASAGYFVASQRDQIVMGNSLPASVGSIGC